MCPSGRIMLDTKKTLTEIVVRQCRLVWPAPNWKGYWCIFKTCK